MTEVVYFCHDKKTTKSQVKCIFDNMGGKFNFFTLNVSDIKSPIVAEEISSFLNYDKKDLKKFIKETFKFRSTPKFKKET